MLQQTQTGRVVEKFREFMRAFPTVEVLAGATPKKVLSLWSGLGYNRRALFLHRAAQAILKEHGGIIPSDIALLEKLPGIGPYTARAIGAFAFNLPGVFIETNIRTVYITHFFKSQKEKEPVSDKELLALVAATLDRKRPREWYAALMDYGAHLKTAGNRSHRHSAHYVRQKPFLGSLRQTRGIILKQLLAHDTFTFLQLKKIAGTSPEQLQAALNALEKEKIILKKGKQYAFS